MAGTRSVDSKPVGTSKGDKDEAARTQPPFRHPGKMDVASSGKDASGSDKAQDKAQDKAKAPERGKDPKE